MDRFFPLAFWPKREARRPQKEGEKYENNISYGTDQANEDISREDSF